MKKKLYYILIIALLIYSALLFYWMLFGFNRQVLSTYHFNFIPFATMKRFLAASRVSHSSRIINLLGNIIVFIPFGLCLPFLFPKKKLYPVLLTFLFVFAVESLQLILRRGAFDIDDFILNAVGYGAGYFIYCILQRFENPFKITEESDFSSEKPARFLKAVCIAGISICVVFLVFVIVVNICIKCSAKKYIYNSLEQLPQKQAALILGAKTYGERLSPVLKDRVDAGIVLQENNKVQVLLLSGDHGRTNYDEVNSMKDYVLRNSTVITPQELFLDHAGFDTYDSIYRARDIFCADSLVIITQKFHAPRAAFIAHSLGIDAIVLALPEDAYSNASRYSWYSREIFADIKAFGDVVFKSKPRYLGEKIPLTSDGTLSWD